MRKLTRLLLLMLVVLAGCQTETPAIVELPTATLMPILSETPRLTATPVPSRTPLPTFTFTPEDTDVPPTATIEPSPTMTPTLMGVVQSMQNVNVREGPGENYKRLTALVPGTGVQIIGRNTEQTWLNIRMEDGSEGWIALRLVFIPPTPTAFPTLTPSPDLTALFLGTPLPTAFMGGGTITPTPPGSVSTATPIGTESTEEAGVPVASASQTGESSSVAFLDVIPEPNMVSLDGTATVLARGAATATSTPTLLPTAEREITLPAQVVPGTPATAAPPEATTEVSSGENQGLTQEQVAALEGIDVFAFCDRTAYGLPAPVNLAAGTTIDIYWAWFAREEKQVLDHVNAATHDLKVNGQSVANVNQFRTRIRRSGADYVTYWYVPFGPLTAGDYEVSYTVTWSQVVSDGYTTFGPGTDKPFEQESCKFRVR